MRSSLTSNFSRAPLRQANNEGTCNSFRSRRPRGPAMFPRPPSPKLRDHRGAGFGVTEQRGRTEPEAGGRLCQSGLAGFLRYRDVTASNRSATEPPVPNRGDDLDPTTAWGRRSKAPQDQPHPSRRGKHCGRSAELSLVLQCERDRLRRVPPPLRPAPRQFGTSRLRRRTARDHYDRQVRVSFPPMSGPQNSSRPDRRRKQRFASACPSGRAPTRRSRTRDDCQRTEHRQIASSSEKTKRRIVVRCHGEPQRLWDMATVSLSPRPSRRLPARRTIGDRFPAKAYLYMRPQGRTPSWSASSPRVQERRRQKRDRRPSR